MKYEPVVTRFYDECLQMREAICGVFLLLGLSVIMGVFFLTVAKCTVLRSSREVIFDTY